MKKTIFLVLVVMVAGIYNNVSAQSKTTTKGGATTVTETTPLTPYYDLSLKIKSHLRGGSMAVPHQATDFVKFGSNGSYESNFNGTSINGTWKYSMTDKTVTLTINGSTMIYSLTVTNGVVEMKTPNETLQLIK